VHNALGRGLRVNLAETPVIYWFRQDLRLADLPALLKATSQGQKVIPCFILDEGAAEEWATGNAGRWWLYHSLLSLDQSLTDRGSGLVVRRGETAPMLAQLAEETGATQIYCSRAYEPWNLELEETVASHLDRGGRQLVSCAGSLLYEPDKVFNRSGQPFRVFTPYWKHCRSKPTPGQPLSDPPPASLSSEIPPGLAPANWGLLPESPGRRWQDNWQPGETGAARRLEQFVSHSLSNYKEGRDHPAMDDTSRLSPHLHWGEVSPRQIWQSIALSGDDSGDKFLSELGWREFSHYLLYHFPHTTDRPFKDRFSNFPWLGQETLFEAWKRGQTGYPIVDAGMRELWHTGFMHNRVRMICASFLTKHLLLPWQWGARWFWDQLLDADLANNTCGWQWVAGCGADAAPYFRIFNPTLQGKKFDTEGAYVRRWVPELSALPNRDLHEPHSLPEATLKQLGVTLGETYPTPVVDHKQAREAALSAWKFTAPDPQQSLPGIDN
jgi:deoxyribodipyrimidine photo-lyase